MVPVDSDRISRVPPYSGFLLEFLIFRLQDFHLLWFIFPNDSTIIRLFSHVRGPTTPVILVWAISAFARHYLRNRFFFLFLRLLRCFSSPGCSHYNYWFIIWYWRFTTSGFPHSDISGLQLTYSSPKHFVVCHVLLHLLMPRHPLCALINLTTIIFLIWWVMRS